MTEFDKNYLNVQLTSLEFNPLLMEPIEPDLQMPESNTRIPNVEKDVIRELKDTVELLNQKFTHDINLIFSMGSNIEDIDKYLEEQANLIGETINSKLLDVEVLPEFRGDNK